MNDLRYVKPVKTIDKITGAEYFRVPVNIIKISENSETLNIYGNEKGTKCRRIVVQICSGNGEIIDGKGVMWETTYKNYFVDMSFTLPYTTMAEFKKTYDDNGFNIIVYALDAICLFCGDTEKPVLTTFELTEMFVENYKDFYFWLKEVSKYK